MPRVHDFADDTQPSPEFAAISTLETAEAFDAVEPALGREPAPASERRGRRGSRRRGIGVMVTSGCAGIAIVGFLVLGGGGSGKSAGIAVTGTGSASALVERHHVRRVPSEPRHREFHFRSHSEFGACDQVERIGHAHAHRVQGSVDSGAPTLHRTGLHESRPERLPIAFVAFCLATENLLLPDLLIRCCAA